MDSNRLSRSQIDRIIKGLYPGRRYLRRLLARMDQRNFPPDDETRKLVAAADDACQRLFVHLHYLSNDKGKK